MSATVRARPMRTNIVIDDDLIAKALEVTGLKTKRAAVEEGLRLLIELSEQASVRDLFGTLEWEGDLTIMREDRIDYSG